MKTIARTRRWAADTTTAGGLNAATQRLDIAPVNGQDMESLTAGAYQAPQEVVAQARELVAAGGGN